MEKHKIKEQQRRARKRMLLSVLQGLVVGCVPVLLCFLKRFSWVFGLVSCSGSYVHVRARESATNAGQEVERLDGEVHMAHLPQRKLDTLAAKMVSLLRLDFSGGRREPSSRGVRSGRAPYRSSGRSPRGIGPLSAPGSRGCSPSSLAALTSTTRIWPDSALVDFVYLFGGVLCCWLHRRQHGCAAEFHACTKKVFCSVQFVATEEGSKRG